jgi:hypothetical protein
MKDLNKTNFFLGLQIEHISNEILVHQSANTEKVLKHFQMDKAHPLCIAIIVRSFYVKNDLFSPFRR